MSGKKRHGHTTATRQSRTYVSWASMLGRCVNPNNPAFKDYGGRGIKVCARWVLFDNFLEDMGDRPAGRTLERIDNAKGYSKDNCKWATKKEQQRNRRDTIFLEFQGKRLGLDDWAEVLNIDRAALRGRMRLGWPVEKILSTPARKRIKPCHHLTAVS